MTQRRMSSSEAMREAEKQAARGDIEEATRLYNAVLTQDATNKKARKGLRDLQRRTQAALSSADFERVYDYLRAGRNDAARSEVQRLAKLHPRQPAIHNLRGAVLVRLDSREEAVEAFTTALNLEPGFNDALSNLASVLSGLGRYPESLNCYQELLKRGPQTPELYNSLGITLRSARRYDDAVESFSRALRLRPAYPDALNNLGNVLNDLQRHDEALDAYTQALGIDPAHRGALLNRARSLLPLGNNNAALADLRTHEEHYGDSLAALNLASYALLGIGQRTAAREKLEALLRLDPKNSSARHLLGALGGDAPRLADPAYARTLFDEFAARFESHLTERLEYHLPAQLPGILKRIDGEDAWYERALDIGCGTGLVGAQVRAFCSELIGVDVAPAMIEKASEKAVYDELAAVDISSWLDSTRASFDLIISADMIIYVGAVDELFRKLAAHMNPGARLIVSTERSEETDLVLRETGRYAHSDAYMRRCAEEAGLKVTATSQINLRKERGEWLEGGLFVFTRPETSGT